MICRKSIYRLLAFVSIIFVSLGFAPKGEMVTEWSGKPVAVNGGPVHETRAYRIYDSQARSERAKMNYLINLVRFSKHRFWRNGRVVRGSWAGRAFEYKMKKYGQDVRTAEEWIEKIGTHSNKTGKEYFIIYPDNKVAPSKMVFKNELDRLLSYENQFAR